jgi:hypothetical protein
MITFLGGDGKTKLTAAANTRIQIACGGYGGDLFTHILNFRYTPGATTHTGTFMRGASRAKVASDLAAAGTALVLDAAVTDGAGNAPANLDVFAVRLDNGDWHVSTISAWSAGTLTATLNTAIPTGRTAKKGAKVVCYGVAGDTMHNQNQVTLTTGSTFQLPVLAGQHVSIVRASAPGEPIIFDSDNATNAGTVDAVQWGYAKR